VNHISKREAIKETTHNMHFVACIWFIWCLFYFLIGTGKYCAIMPSTDQLVGNLERVCAFPFLPNINNAYINASTCFAQTHYVW